MHLSPGALPCAPPVASLARMRDAVPIAILLLAASASSFAQLRPETSQAFDRYVQRAERRIQQEQASPASFLFIDRLPEAKRAEAERRLRSGEVLIQSSGGAELPHGLVHDWIGIAFIPGATVQQTLALVQDYDHLSRYYSPRVQSSRLLAHSGDDFRLAMRLREHKVIVVMLDTEYQVHYGRLDGGHWFSESRSTRVDEIANPGATDEHPQPPADQHGFLWRLNSYWRFAQAPDGVFIQCEAISLTRDIPAGLGWLVKPFVQSIPRESLQFTLQATRKTVLENSSHIARSEHDHDD